MIKFKKTGGRFLLIGLLLMSISGIAEARSDHHSKNKGYQYNRGHNSAFRQNHSIGHRVSYLPTGYLALSFAGLNYYYNSGAYYQRRGHEYAVISPPLGLSISILPAGYRTHRYGRHTYYSVNDVFYGWNDSRRSYVVVDNPDPYSVAGTTTYSQAEQFVYPRQGQNLNQTSRDRYECYLWAVGQTGVEPAQINNTQTSNNLGDYQRANGACLEARGYSVK